MHEIGLSEPGSLRRAWGAVFLTVILLLGAGLRLWGLERNGFGQEYYAAGVLSMMTSLHNFVFVAFDPAGFVSVDKPPIALWIQVASAELFGFSGLSLILPQVAEGLLTVLLLYWLVARRFGRVAGLLAAGVLAMMPVSVAVDRSNNTDSCLVLVLVLAVAAAIRAIERRSFAWLLAAMIAIGIGFNVKMAAAFGIAPVLCLAYLLAPPRRWWPRLLQLAAAGSVGLVVAFSWFVAVDAVAPENRPYAGSTTDNSMLQMVFVQYGIDRFVPRPWRGERRAALETAAAGPAQLPAGFVGDRVPIGPLRLADPRLGGQIGWFFPLALLGAIALFRRQAGDAPERNDLLIWVGWLLVYGAVFSFAGGIFHAYYLVAMAPPIAALTGAGVVALWGEHRLSGGWLLPIALAAMGLWQTWLGHESLGAFQDWRSWLFVGTLAGTLLGALGLIVARVPRRPGLALSALALGLAAGAATPMAWALSTVLAQGNVSFPAADIALLAPGAEARARPFRGMRSDRFDDSRLVAYLQQNRGDARYLLGTQTAIQAAPIILKSGAPVMAVGGYTGGDPIITPDTLAQLVDNGELRFFLLREDERGGFPRNPQGQTRWLAEWEKGRGRPVDPALWRGSEPEGRGQYELYDLPRTGSASP